MSIALRRRSDGTIQRARIKQPWPKGRIFRILSIDGGGIRGVFPAAYLAELEHRFLGGRSIGSCFDMVAGTSTGGIIALALAHGMTAQQGTTQRKCFFWTQPIRLSVARANKKIVVPDGARHNGHLRVICLLSEFSTLKRSVCNR